MGRGNVCVFGKHEGLYYLYWECFMDNEDIDKKPDQRDYNAMRENYEADRDIIVEYFCDRFKSFSRCDKWVRRAAYSRDTDHAIAENKLYYLFEVDNEWSMAIMLVQKEEPWGLPYLEIMQAKHFPTYFQGLKECLFELFPEIGAYGGAWTHRTLRRNEERKVS